MYEIMHKSRIVARIDVSGHCRVYYKSFMPYNLYLEEAKDVDSLVDNSNNKPIGIHKLMDFNQAFHAYDRLEGANCQTAFGRPMTQREAAVEAVKTIGLNQTKQVKRQWFSELPQFYEMFARRLESLESVKCS